jgi:hypothetical protein
MPYEIKKSGDNFVVVNQDTGKMVPGGSHPSKAKALAHMRALYANVPDASKKAITEKLDEAMKGSRSSSLFERIKSVVSNRVQELKGGPGSGRHSEGGSQRQGTENRGERGGVSGGLSAKLEENNAIIKAENATERAKDSGKASDHQAAAQAHRVAASKIGIGSDDDSARVSHHLSMADSHNLAAIRARQ